MSVVRLADEHWYAVCEDALDDFGYILQLGDTAGQVKKSLGSTKVLGIAYKSTVSPIDGDADSNITVAIVRHGQVNVKFGATHSAIAVGDTVKAITGGLGDKQTVTDAMVHSERLIRIGTALTALAVNTAGHVVVDLNLPE